MMTRFQERGVLIYFLSGLALNCKDFCKGIGTYFTLDPCPVSNIDLAALHKKFL